MVPWLAGRGLGKMWQNVSKIFPLFCGKIFEIFCHGLPAGGGQLFRTSTIFLPLLTPTFRRTPVNDSRHCVKFCCFRKSDCSRLCTGYQARSFADKHCVTLCLVFRRQALSYSLPGLSLTSLVLPTAIPACVPWRLVCCHCGMSIRSIRSIRSTLQSVS